MDNYQQQQGYYQQQPYQQPYQQPQQPQQAYQQPQPIMNKPDNNMAWAIISLVMCCLWTGIPAVLAASKVDSLWAQGRYTEAYEKAASAKKWAMWGAIGSVIFWVLYIVVYVVIMGAAIAMN